MGYICRKQEDKNFESIWNFLKLLISGLIKGLKTDQKILGIITKESPIWSLVMKENTKGKILKSSVCANKCYFILHQYFPNYLGYMQSVLLSLIFHLISRFNRLFQNSIEYKRHHWNIFTILCPGYFDWLFALNL